MSVVSDWERRDELKELKARIQAQLDEAEFLLKDDPAAGDYWGARVELLRALLTPEEPSR